MHNKKYKKHNTEKESSFVSFTQLLTMNWRDLNAVELESSMDDCSLLKEKIFFIIKISIFFFTNRYKSHEMLLEWQIYSNNTVREGIAYVRIIENNSYRFFFQGRDEGLILIILYEIRQLERGDRKTVCVDGNLICSNFESEFL